MLNVALVCEMTERVGEEMGFFVFTARVCRGTEGSLTVAVFLYSTMAATAHEIYLSGL